MQAFLTNNTVNCNLMSLTGYRTLVILIALMDSPKSIDEINECLFNNQYIKEKFSRDTLRIYINSLRAVGCEITPANKSNNQKYKLLSHPFAYEIPQNQLKALAKVYKTIYDKINVEEVIVLEDFFKKLNGSIKNQNANAFLENLSILKHIDRNMLNDISSYCRSKKQITFLYNSPKSGPKEIEFICDKLSIKSGKLYLWGTNLSRKEYSYFLIERILKICSINILKAEKVFPSFNVIYELYNHNDNFIAGPDEKIVSRSSDKLVIEVNSKNEFDIMQRILYMANDCKVLQPEEFRLKLLNQLKKMNENYAEI